MKPNAENCDITIAPGQLVRFSSAQIDRQKIDAMDIALEKLEIENRIKRIRNEEIKPLEEKYNETILSIISEGVKADEELYGMYNPDKDVVEYFDEDGVLKFEAEPSSKDRIALRKKYGKEFAQAKKTEEPTEANRAASN